MREILFRGKPKNKADYEFLKKMYKDNCKDGFIYGSLVISHGKYYICIMALCQINSLVNNGITTMFEVIPETVGEYTGLTDKNGTKIFEGDIIKAGNGHIGWAEFFRGAFVKRCLCHPNSYNPIWGDNETVIGNIHDNPVNVVIDR